MNQDHQQMPAPEEENSQSDNGTQDVAVDLDTRPDQKDTKNNQYLVPMAIVVAGAMITAGIMFTRGQPSVVAQNAGNNDFGNTLSASAANIRLPDDSEHVRGNPSAPVAIVEFSDFQCPFCERIHPTLSRILDEYDGQVKWIYRHFPLASIHAEATQSAVASECVAELAGNEAFWQFVDDIFANQSSMGEQLYYDLGRGYGIAENKLKTCLNSKDMADRVMEDLIDATEGGGQGTPYVVVFNQGGKPFPFSGALPYEQIRAVVEQALSTE